MSIRQHGYFDQEVLPQPDRKVFRKIRYRKGQKANFGTSREV